MAKNIVILGSTGSIGTQTLDVASRLDDVSVMGLSANYNIKLLEQQVRRFRPKAAAVGDEKSAALFKIAVADMDLKVLSGQEGICHLAAMEGADTAVTALVGVCGLVPTMAAIDSGKDIALANKETLVTAGDLVMACTKEKNVRILPVDSEHCAVFQCLEGKGQYASRLILTASGGAFYGRTRFELADVTAADALRHPNWNMGAKITIDCATMMNKGLEVIEAHHLFNMPYRSIDVVIHRQSVVHSMVEFVDGSVIAQLGVPDMRLPIQYALLWPERRPSPVDRLDFASLQSLTFANPDKEAFPCLGLAYTAGELGGTAPVCMNAANEVAVQRFLDGEIKFLQISEIVERALSDHKNKLNPTLQDIIETDKSVRSAIENGGRLC